MLLQMSHEVRRNNDHFAKKENSLVAAKPHKEENFVKYFFIMQLRCYEKALNFYYFRKNIKVNVRLFLTINT